MKLNSNIITNSDIERSLDGRVIRKLLRRHSKRVINKSNKTNIKTNKILKKILLLGHVHQTQRYCCNVSM